MPDPFRKTIESDALAKDQYSAMEDLILNCCKALVDIKPSDLKEG